jgi:RimJ/RimL family protein N-acetyltransferase
MEIAFRPIDPRDDEDVAAMTRWSNASDRHLHTFYPDEASYRERVTETRTREYLQDARKRGKRIHMILVDGAVVGHVDFEVDSIDSLQVLSPGSAWLSILVGETAARGRGVGKAALRHIEAAARAEGCVRAEVGVFEFNEVARRLYESAGYVEFARNEDFTWWHGVMWADLRLEKRLS